MHVHPSTLEDTLGDLRHAAQKDVAVLYEVLDIDAAPILIKLWWKPERFCVLIAQGAHGLELALHLVDLTTLETLCVANFSNLLILQLFSKTSGASKLSRPCIFEDSFTLPDPAMHRVFVATERLSWSKFSEINWEPSTRIFCMFPLPLIKSGLFVELFKVHRLLQLNRCLQ